MIGLAEGLRQELLPHDIGIHLYLPGTILTPGYEKENQIKPEVTKKLEAGSGFSKPEDCALQLLKGMEKNHFIITSDFDTEIIRASTIGLSSVSGRFWLWDILLATIGWFIFGFIRRSQDKIVLKEANKNK